MAKASGPRGGGGSPPQMKPDRIVETVAPDPSIAPSIVTLTGFLGKGTEEGNWRLYFTASLNEYVEFADPDVVHHEPIPQDQSSLGGTTVWLKAGTTLRYIYITSQQIQADFLQGGLISDFLPGTKFSALRGAAVAGTGAACTRNYICSTNPHIPACQLRTEVCGSFDCGPPTGALCPTGAFIKGC